MARLQVFSINCLFYGTQLDGVICPFEITAPDVTITNAFIGDP